MNPLKSALLIVALTLAAALGLAQDHSQAQQFQEAITMMETKGNYTAAIRLFEQAAKGADRTLAARALYYAGQCYEKSGKDKAQQAYQRVIKQFAEQRQVVADARARLSALSPSVGNVAASKAASGPTVRQVLAGPDLNLNDANVSHDGRYLVEQETKDVTIRDLITGEKRRLTNKASQDEKAYGSIFSPDGKQIATVWWVKKDKKAFEELRIMGIDGSGSRVLYRNDSDIAPYDWSPDSKHILVHLPDESHGHILLISVADGSTRILKSVRLRQRGRAWEGFGRMKFSPDGRYIAYEYYQQNDPDQHDISIISTSDGSHDAPLVQSPADDKLLGWAPDGKSILFTSNRSRTIDVWIMPVADGKPQGSPELVKRDIGKIIPFDVTRNGSFYYCENRTVTRISDLYTATLAPETGKLIGSPVQAKTRFTGMNGGQDWSPDGRYLVYRSYWGMDVGNAYKLVILNPETGEEREVQTKLKRFWMPRWFPDGKSILLRDVDGKPTIPQGPGAGFFKIDSETGDATLLMPEKPLGIGMFELSRDGKALFYQLKNALWIRNLENGEEKEIYRSKPPNENDGPANLVLSPDGQRLAFQCTQSLFVVPTTGGEARELLKVKQLGTTGTLAWTPDGRYLLFIQNGYELWRIPAEGGEPQKLGQLMGVVWDLRVNPDGQRIAFGVFPGNKTDELWVMENFLPTAQPRKAAVSHR